MKLKNLSFDDPRWDKFCWESDDCWFYHTTDNMKYSLEYCRKDTELLAFYIEDGNENILSICPLMRYKNKLSFCGSESPNPALQNSLSAQLSKKLLRQMFSKIDEIAMNSELDECIMCLDPLAKNHLTQFTYNYLMKYGYENVSLNTQIIDLDKDERTLWGEIKKSHRNEIKKGNTKFKIVMYEPFKNNLKHYEVFKNLHFLAAGRKTRPDETWDLQYKWMLQGNTVLSIAYLEDQPVGGILASLYKNNGVYAISANHPDYGEFPITHSIQWEMIKWLKQNRYRYYVLGIQYFSEQPYSHPTHKDIDISLFKRHFGGFTVTFHRGIKKYT